MGLLPMSVNGKQVQLVLKGFMKEPFNLKLGKIIEERSIQENVEFHGVTSYKEVPKVTASCHIGIAIFAKDDIMNKTPGTASNKIYEYAACGLPVLYYDNEHFRTHLSKYKWAVATNLTNQSLMDSIAFIDSNYAELSEAARSDFENELNFEKQFKALATELGERINL